MLAVRCQLLATLSVVAVVAHSFRIMFLVYVRAFRDCTLGSAFLVPFNNILILLILIFFADLGALIEVFVGRMTEWYLVWVTSIITSRGGNILLILLSLFHWLLFVYIFIEQLLLDFNFLPMVINKLIALLYHFWNYWVHVRNDRLLVTFLVFVIGVKETIFLNFVIGCIHMIWIRLFIVSRPLVGNGRPRLL